MAYIDRLYVKNIFWENIAHNREKTYSCDTKPNQENMQYCYKILIDEISWILGLNMFTQYS